VRAHVCPSGFLRCIQRTTGIRRGLCLLGGYNDGTRDSRRRAISPGRAEREGDRAPIRTVSSPKRRAAALALHLPDAVEAHGNDGDAKVFGQQANTTLKWAISPVAVLFTRPREKLGRCSHGQRIRRQSENSLESRKIAVAEKR